jgi:hypothetical protein
VKQNSKDIVLNFRITDDSLDSTFSMSVNAFAMDGRYIQKHVHFKSHDALTFPFKINIKSQLPPITSVGDIIRMHRVKRAGETGTRSVHHFHPRPTTRPFFKKVL